MNRLQNNNNITPQRPVTPEFLQAYKDFVQHMNKLMQSGYNSTSLQNYWQEYYNNLSDDEKRYVWHDMRSIATPASRQPVEPTPVEPRIVTQQPLPNTISPNSPPVSQEIPPSNTQESLPDQKISRKARNMFIWNSPTALFNKEESRSIKRQNIKSLVFGLTIGLIFLVIFQFTFFNERLVQPFIRPASYSSDVQVIIPPGGRQISDPNWSVIIPKLGIQPPVVGSVPSYRSVDPNETGETFEARMQEALESGVVHYPSSPLPGQQLEARKSNTVIVGHSSANLFTPGDYKSVFSSLRNLELGDLILVNYQQTQYVYKIYAKKIVLPSAVEVLGEAERNHSLTLITCDPPGSSAKRLVLVAEQISPHPEGNIFVELQSGDTDDIIVPGNSRGLLDNF